MILKKTNKQQNYFIASWSGGKDSCLTFYYAIQEGLKPAALINMLTEGPNILLKENVIKKQAAALKMSLSAAIAQVQKFNRTTMFLIRGSVQCYGLLVLWVGLMRHLN